MRRIQAKLYSSIQWVEVATTAWASRVAFVVCGEGENGNALLHAKFGASRFVAAQPRSLRTAATGVAAPK